MLFFNGRLDPLSNISGMISRPIKKSNPLDYTTSFPPMAWGIDFLRASTGFAEKSLLTLPVCIIPVLTHSM